LNNHDNHHGANLPGNVNDGSGGTWSRCNVCHDYSGRPVPHLDPGRPNDPTYHDVGGPGFELAIRICEECHSVATLHNIQADTNGDGVITVGGELAGYGHVGKDGGPGDSDCWGCHGFQAAGSSVPFTGPLVPTLYNADVATISAGKDTTLLLSGASFTNTANGKSYVSDVRLTGANGTSVTLTPDVVLDQGSLAVTIPAATQPGNYKLQAAKGNMASNPTVISVTPKVTINRATARRTTVTITGSGFAGYASGSGTAVTSGKVRGSEPVEATIISWTDTRIIVRFPTLPTTVTVHSVFGSVTARIASR
jgi:hypothetical protein